SGAASWQHTPRLQFALAHNTVYSYSYRRRTMQGVPIKGRGSLSNHDSRFAAFTREAFLDDWSPYSVAANPSELPAEFPPEVVPEARPPTTVSTERARSIISRNTSPDIPFDQSVNAYRGCEHGCIYCYARPSHAYLDLSPGLDFETRLYAKSNAPEVLRKELARNGYVPKLIAMGTNTDPYQPIERRLRITAALLEVF